MKRLKLNFPQFLFAIVLLALASCAADESNPQLRPSRSLNYQPAKTNAELLTLTKDVSNNMIRNYDDFDAVVAAGNTPLSKLSIVQLAEFRNGLVFRNNGIAGLRYGTVKEALTETEYVAVMSLLGLDVQNGFWYGANSKTNRNNADVPDTDYKGYWCQKEHSCYEDKNSICTSNC